MTKKIVKFSSPVWNDFGFENVGIAGQTPGCTGEWGNYHFEINNDCDECDYWVVYESTPKKEVVKVPPGNTILMTSEEVLQRSYIPSYLAQFDRIITSRADLQGGHVIHDYYCNAWFVRRTYDQLKAETQIEKKKKISVVASSLTRRDGHKKRYAFVNQLIGHFKDRIDVYGRGFNFVEDKYDALAPYKFSVAIENESIYNYWTEKVVDCFLTHTFPFYFGCPNLADYLPHESFMLIDINNFNSSIQMIEQTLEEDIFDERLEAIKASKRKILDELQFFPYITRHLDSNAFPEDLSRKKRMQIYPSDDYLRTTEFRNKIHEIFTLGGSLIKRLIK